MAQLQVYFCYKEASLFWVAHLRHIATVKTQLAIILYGAQFVLQIKHSGLRLISLSGSHCQINVAVKVDGGRTKLWAFVLCSRLYVSPKAKLQGESLLRPLQWCRQVLDHPGPEVELAKMTFCHRLDQGTVQFVCVCLPVRLTAFHLLPHLDICLSGRRTCDHKP